MADGQGAPQRGAAGQREGARPGQGRVGRSAISSWLSELLII